MNEVVVIDTCGEVCITVDGGAAAVADLVVTMESAPELVVTIAESGPPGQDADIAWIEAELASKADLAGRGGGQTLIGGTGVGDALVLQGTSANGEATTKAVRVVVGDNGDAEVIFARNNGEVVLGGAIAAKAGEVSIGGAPFGVFTGVGSAPYLPMLPLRSSFNVEASLSDDLNNCAGAVLVSTVDDLVLNANRRAGLVVDTTRPSSTLVNSGDIIGVRNTVAVAGAIGTARTVGIDSEVVIEDTGTIGYVLGASSKIFYSSAGINNVGMNALLGYIFVGSTGYVQRIWGTEGIVELQSGASAARLIGVGAVIKAPAGSTVRNSVAGVSIGGTGGEWVGGATFTVPVYAIWIGANTNIGAVGNTWAVFSQSTAPSYLAGSLGIGVTAPSAKTHVIATTEQLRLGRDAANYTSCTVSSAGVLTITTIGTAPALYIPSDFRLDKTITASGTNGAQTINKNAGSVNFAIGATSLVVTNSRVTGNSVITATVATNDTTMKSVAVVAAAGSFTLYANDAPTAATRVNFAVFN